MSFKKFLFVITFISIAIVIGIAGYLYFAKQRPVLAQIAGESIYISQLGAGSQDGSDCNNARPVSWFNTVGNWANPKQAGKIGPGDTAHLCGTFTGVANSTILTMQASGTSGNVITILFEVGSILQSPQFSAQGAINIAGKSYIKITSVNSVDRGIIKNTDNGTGKTYDASSNGINTNGGSNIEISYLTIEGIYINYSTNSTGNKNGWDTADILVDDDIAFDNILIHDCVLNDSHAGVWVNFEGMTVANMQIYNNYISSHAWGIVVGAGTNNSNITVDIHDNEITNWTLWDYPYHGDGLIIYSNASTNTSYNGKFYNNYIHGNLGYFSPSGYVGAGCGGKNFLIYNNLFKCESPDRGGSCMVVYNAGQCAGAQPINTTFYNNISIGASSTKTTWEGLALKVARLGVYMTVRNNIFVDYFWPLYDVNDDWSGFTGNGSADYNIYYGHTHIIGNERYPSTPYYLDLNSFRESPYYQEAHGLYFDPLFVSSSDFHLQSGSPARDAGVNLGSYFQTDKDGISRPQGSAWDIGAYEYIQASPPLKGDFNSDFKVNDLDFTSFKNAFKSIFNSIFDLNSDNAIDVKDLGVLMSGWLP